jgi:KaiC/GvpD/RAD55 family RecA-like ATPase
MERDAKGGPPPLRRVESGVPGLDELCGGGLPGGKIHLLTGSPGAGKTTLALQFLVHGAARAGEPGVYITTDQLPSEIRATAGLFGWDLPSLERRGALVILDALSVRLGSPHTERWSLQSRDLSGLLTLLSAVLEFSGARRVVVDSLTSLLALNPDYTASQVEAGETRGEVLRFAHALKGMGTTALLIAERRTGQDSLVENFVADGVIHIHTRRVLDSRFNSVEVLKLRGSAHSRKIHPFSIGPDGVTVNPKEAVFGEF